MSDFFRWFPAENHRKLTGIHQKKSGQFPIGILLPCSSDLRCFPAGSGDFPASFLQDPAGSGGRNHRLRLVRISDPLICSIDIDSGTSHQKFRSVPSMRWIKHLLQTQVFETFYQWFCCVLILWSIQLLWRYSEIFYFHWPRALASNPLEKVWINYFLFVRSDWLSFGFLRHFS